MNRWNMRFVPMLGVAALGALAGCGSDDEGNTEALQQAMTEAVAQYSEVVHTSYVDSLAAAKTLDETIRELVGAPTEARLAAARSAWIAAREPYLQTEVYRFYDGPIDDPEDGPEGLLNAWPLDEAYIDYVVDEEQGGVLATGIINDPAHTIDAESLVALNEQGKEDNIATGYHAVEFLLWGQDLSDTSPGERPVTDYTQAENADRRALYLSTVAGLLVEHLEWLVAAWAENEENYRESLEEAAPKEALRRIMTGMIELSGTETGGERLQKAFDSGDENDEHSCFSDNTHRDMVQDIRGILNVWRGEYRRLDGTTLQGSGVRDVVRLQNASLSSDIEAQIQDALALADALEPPFDNEIQVENTAGRARVQALITSVNELDRLLKEAFVELGLVNPGGE